MTIVHRPADVCFPGEGPGAGQILQDPPPFQGGFVARLRDHHPRVLRTRRGRLARRLRTYGDTFRHVGIGWNLLNQTIALWLLHRSRMRAPAVIYL